MAGGGEQPDGAGGAAAAPSAPPSAAKAKEPGRARNPVQIQIPNTEERSGVLKSYTAYIIHVSDFGRSYQVEKRFDDFAKLHAELAEVDPNIPPIPEKKMWASTDASTVAERRPAFEKILRHLLRSEEVVMEKGQILWKFLDMPPPGVVAARYTFKSAHRLSYARQCGKLLDPKYEKEHAYRLAHESVIKTNLQLLTSDLPAAAAKPQRGAAAGGGGGGGQEPKFEAASFSGAASFESPSPEAEQGEAAKEPPPAPSPAGPAQAEAAALEMLRWALANGGEAARRAFLEEKGLAAMLTLLFQKGREESAAGGPGGREAVPNPQIRTVMNALVKGEGDKYPHVFAEFLVAGGVTLLSDAKDVFQSSQGFSEFISKLLWIAWDEEVQRAFLQGAYDREALGLLSALFQCPSRTARVCAGLLLSSSLASQLLEGKEEQAAAGVYSLVEEMVALSPAWTKDAAGSPGDPKASGAGASGDSSADKKAEADMVAFVQTVGQNEDRFSRILNCVDAPWRLNDGNLPDEDCPLWAPCAFALWCLLKLRPKPSRLANVRIALPAVSQAAPARVRWLAGELLLMLQLQSPSQLSSNGQFGEIEAVVEMTYQESAALEAVLREQVEHSRQNVRSELEQNQSVMESQRSLTQERQQEIGLLGSPPWHRPLDDVLRSLGAAREKLTGAIDATETRRQAALGSVQEVLALELGAGAGGDEPEERDLSVKLEGMREVEASYLAKKQEFAQAQEVLKEQDKIVEDANSAMERADKEVQESRRQIMELESQISTKQRDAQSKRTMASSDFSALKGQLLAEMDSIKMKQAKVREKALKIQNGEQLDAKGVPLDATAAADEMTRLKREAAQHKARNAELQAEQSRMSADPATLEQQARASEEAVQRLSCERDALRDALHGLEGAHAGAREVWQHSMTDVMRARQQKEVSERECNGLRQQLDSVWASWQPLHAKRLQTWRSRVLALSTAQQGGRRLVEAVGSGWDGLRSERTLRVQVLGAVRELQGQLAMLSEELMAVDDQTLDALDCQ